MLSNIEQAITNIIAANRPPNYANVFNEYLRICGPSRNGDLFERVLDKYVDAKDKVTSPFAKLVAELRNQHWETAIDAAITLFGERLPCPCCGVVLGTDDIRRKLGLLDEEEPVPITIKPKKIRTRRITKKTRSRKATGEALAFDPYGPSTSAASM